MKDPIHILCATDDNYIPYYGIMLTSLFENNPDERFSIFVLSSGLQPLSISSLHSLTSAYGHSIQFVAIEEKDLVDCPIRPGDHVTLATYYRLVAASVLPEDISKILWLDGDLIIDGPVRELWETNLSSFAIGTVKDESYCHPDIYQRLQLNPDIPYTSAGVLLINLDYWREHKSASLFFNYIRENRDKLLFHDQDTLNVVFQDKKILLPVIWNFQSGFITAWEYPNYPVPLQEEIFRAARKPIIIHYSGPSKPWFRFNIHPYRKVFEHYQRLSPWKDFPPKSFGLKHSIRDGIGKMLRDLHLRRSPYIFNNQPE